MPFLKALVSLLLSKFSELFICDFGLITLLLLVILGRVILYLPFLAFLDDLETIFGIYANIFFQILTQFLVKKVVHAQVYYIRCIQKYKKLLNKNWNLWFSQIYSEEKLNFSK